MNKKCMALILIFTHTSIGLAANCTKGMSFDQTLNRCVLSKNTVENKSDALNCDGKSGDEYKECFHANVSDELKDAQNDGKIKSASKPNSKYLVPAIVTIASGLILFTENDILAGCSSTSTYLMGAAGATSLLGELLAQRSYKKATDDLKKKYTARMSDKVSGDASVIDSVNENQKIAFEFQIEQEEARQKAHKARKNAYNVAMALYAASSIAALSEILFPGSEATCKSKTNDNYLKNIEGFEEYAYLKTINQLELQEIVLRKLSNIFFIPNAQAFPLALSSISSLIPPPVIASTSGILKSAIRSTFIRAAFSGMLANYSRNIATQASDHAKESNKRIKVLQELRDSFVSNGGADFSNCSEAERKNANSPSCFCFTETGAQDPAKSGQKVCKDFLAGKSAILATRYGTKSSSESGGLKGCFAENKNFDPECKCKSQVSKTDSKKNSCLKFSGKVNLGSLAKLTGTKALIQDSLAFNRGDIGTGALSGSAGNAKNLVSAIDKKKNELLKDEKFAPSLKKVNELEKKLSNQFSNNIANELQNGSIDPTGLLGGVPTSLSSTDPKEVLKDFKYEMNKPKFQQGKSENSNSRSSKLGDYDFGNGTKGEGLNFDESVDEVMKNEYSFNDISENSENNLFKIITNRYHNSGMRILFDDKGLLEPEKANNSDINEK